MKVFIKKVLRNLVNTILRFMPKFLKAPLAAVCRYTLNKITPTPTPTILDGYNYQNLLQNFEKRFLLRAYTRYPRESLEGKRFYNIGAGFQRSATPYWTYVDLLSPSYAGNQPDIPFDLEELLPLPLPEGEAEIFYNSFLLEHISWGATQNLIKESFRCLKKGGVFHCRVHSCTYGLFLYRHNVVTDKFFYTRESAAALRRFVEENFEFLDSETADSFVDNTYRITASNGKTFEVTPRDGFLVYNGTSLSKFAEDHPSLDEEIPEGSAAEVYAKLQSQVQPWFQKQYPHSHNFQYIDTSVLMEQLKKAGFSKVYPMEIGQSVAPPLWESCFNTVHSGFNFGVEAIK